MLQFSVHRQCVNMAVCGVVCRSSVLLVFDISRAFSLSCFVGAGPCNKVKITLFFLLSC